MISSAMSVRVLAVVENLLHSSVLMSLAFSITVSNVGEVSTAGQDVNSTNHLSRKGQIDPELFLLDGVD
jgi:hypothetical protein